MMSLARSETLWSPYGTDEVERVLQDTFEGVAVDGTFKLTAPRSMSKNSWRPMMVGTYEAGDTGTLIHVSYPMHVFVLVFTLIHGIPFMGISWLMGFWFWRMGVEEMSTELRRTISVGGAGADAFKAAEDEVSDPTQPGAAGGAPGSLRPMVLMNGVTFGVGGAGDKQLVVDQVGLTLTWRDLQLPWDAIETIDLDPLERLCIVTEAGEDFCVGLQSAHTEDRLWLAVYLQTRNQVGSGSDDERAAAERERERLAAVVRQPGG